MSPITQEQVNVLHLNILQHQVLDTSKLKVFCMQYWITFADVGFQYCNWTI